MKNTENQRIIGLITDFGLRGWHYVAAMKAVILGINPHVNIIDVHHFITSYSIIEASFVIKTVYKLFPQESIFVIVVDPGVGSPRKIVALKTKSNHYFVGPDNGIFWLALGDNGINSCVNVQNDQYYRKPVSNTFHGRDIMAPVGAYISTNVSLGEFGPEFDTKTLIQHPITYKVSLKHEKIKCTIQYVDKFGNVVTNVPIVGHNIKGTNFKLQEGSSLKLKINREDYKAIFQSYYRNSSPNQLLLIKGSSGYLELSLNQESVAKTLNLKTGDTIQITL